LALLTREHTIGTKKLYDGYIINLRLDELRMPDGRTTTREVVEHNGGVVIIAQPSPDEIILIRQYRYTVDEELIEFPAGRIEKGEDPFPCAQRELIEETGYKAEKWQELARMYSAPGFCNEMLYLYLASELSFVGKNLDEDEETEVVVMRKSDAWQLVLDGKVRDAKTIAGIGLVR
jgi:ADP-ribose pyrophosphatase